MGKRKTLRQKQHADTKRQQSLHQEVSLASPSSLYSFSHSQVHKQTVTYTPSSTVAVTVVHDLRKTALISILIVALQVLLFILLQNHVLALPFVRY